MASMGIILIASLATAFILTAVDSLLIPLGKWRGLLAFVLATLALINLEVKWLYLLVYACASTFIGLTVSLLVDQIFAGATRRDIQDLPRRVDIR
jgi:hypothetical protein